MASKGKHLFLWAASVAAAAACGGDENNAGGKQQAQCEPPTDPACYGEDAWGNGGAPGGGAGGYVGVPGAGGAAARPPGCGNGTLDSGEACDGADLAGATCATGTMGAMPNGVVTCSPDCALVYSGCTGSIVGGTGGTGSGTGGTGGTGG
jgi:hypothetical protein